MIKGLDFATKVTRTHIGGLLDGKASVSLIDFYPRFVSLDSVHRVPEHHVAHCARMSFALSANAALNRSVEQDNRLVKYLAKHRHTSPFEMCGVTYKITVPNFVGKHFLRHRTFKFNEVSQRYTIVPTEVYNPAEFEIRSQDPNKKQCSRTMEDTHKKNNLKSLIRDNNKRIKDVFETYEKMLDLGMSQESARYCLPLGTYTTMIVSSDLNNLYKMLSLRTGGDAQEETQHIARAMKELATPMFPITMSSL